MKSVIEIKKIDEVKDMEGRSRANLIYWAVMNYVNNSLNENSKVNNNNTKNTKSDNYEVSSN